MSLDSDLAVRRGQASPAYLDQIARMAAHLDRTGMPQGCRQVGDPAPDFALATAAGRRVGLSGLLRSGPVVVSFFRGEWCRFCRAEIEALLTAQPGIERYGASLLLISPEPASETLAAAVEGLGSRAAVMTDPSLGVALLYGLTFLVPDALKAFYMDTNPDLSCRLAAGSWMLPIPADFIVGTDGRIVLSYADPDFTRRLDPSIILDTLANLSGA